MDQNTTLSKCWVIPLGYKPMTGSFDPKWWLILAKAGSKPDVGFVPF